jgi:hypothetical protein
MAATVVDDVQASNWAVVNMLGPAAKEVGLVLMLPLGNVMSVKDKPAVAGPAPPKSGSDVQVGAGFGLGVAVAVAVGVALPPTATVVVPHPETTSSTSAETNSGNGQMRRDICRSFLLRHRAGPFASWKHLVGPARRVSAPTETTMGAYTGHRRRWIWQA